MNTITPPHKEFVDKILREVQNYYQVNLFEKTRKRETVFPRQVAMYLIRTFTPLSLREAGEPFGKDHSVAIHSIKVVKNNCKNYPYIRQQIIEIESRIE